MAAYRPAESEPETEAGASGSGRRHRCPGRRGSRDDQARSAWRFAETRLERRQAPRRNRKRPHALDHRKTRSRARPCVALAHRSTRRRDPAGLGVIRPVHGHHHPHDEVSSSITLSAGQQPFPQACGDWHEPRWVVVTVARSTRRSGTGPGQRGGGCVFPRDTFGGRGWYTSLRCAGGCRVWSWLPCFTHRERSSAAGPRHREIRRPPAPTAGRYSRSRHR